ncbi:hypothetical protein PO124_09585 [Bacillus licheniformis]|nr:hypothetical protein [Bacillus licheniformis]
MVYKAWEQAKAPKQVLLAQVPSFANQDAMLNMTAKLDSWFQAEKDKQIREDIFSDLLFIFRNNNFLVKALTCRIVT